jgi:2-keto-4-pentenoate hydratase/2-oxohepta-3-ene-1,7-dioic acid hydratase in catechol pathway
MRLVSFVTTSEPRRLRLGAELQGSIVDLACARSWAQGARNIPSEEIPSTLPDLIHSESTVMDYLNRLVDSLNGEDPTHLKGARREAVGYSPKDAFLYPPLMHPISLRDFYAFEAHVKKAAEIRKREVAEGWYRLPVFYYGNPNNIFGPEMVIPYPTYTQELDYELEIACVIGKMGRDIPVDEAERYIFGYMIMNDWSARDIQQVEMKVGLGPAKAKDFATSLGPWIVTQEELSDRKTDRPGVYDLAMVARVNGEERSRGNLREIHYSFGEMISRASTDCYLMPGDVIGSGTVGTGCLLELTEGKGPWLKPGDQVELEIERLGVLRNVIGEISKH